MTTTELINLLKKVEFGASGRARKISFNIQRKNNKIIFLSEPEITINGTGDGTCGAEISLLIKENK